MRQRNTKSLANLSKYYQVMVLGLLLTGGSLQEHHEPHIHPKPARLVGKDDKDDL
jgi:hypothetical protein